MLSGSGTGAIHEHQKGHRVAPVSLADYLDLLDVYQRTYKLALNLAVERGDDAWEKRRWWCSSIARSRLPKVMPDGDPRGPRAVAAGLWRAPRRNPQSAAASPLLLQIQSNLGGRLERYVNLLADLESDRTRDSSHRSTARSSTP